MDLRVPVTRIADILAERRGITADTALRLGRYFNMTPQFWMNMQTHYELNVAEDEVLADIERDVRPISTKPQRTQKTKSYADQISELLNLHLHDRAPKRQSDSLAPTSGV